MKVRLLPLLAVQQLRTPACAYVQRACLVWQNVYFVNLLCAVVCRLYCKQ